MAVAIVQCTTNSTLHYTQSTYPHGSVKKCNLILMCSANSVTFRLLVLTMQMMCWN